ARFEAGKADILARLRRAEAVASDETGVRIEGANAQQWVFRSKDAVLHEMAFSRSAKVARGVMGGHRPVFWTSDRYSAQQGHGLNHQTLQARRATMREDREELPIHRRPHRHIRPAEIRPHRLAIYVMIGTLVPSKTRKR
ncbi:MAG: transposase, partial [Pikeienuella sp.]